MIAPQILPRRTRRSSDTKAASEAVAIAPSQGTVKSHKGKSHKRKAHPDEDGAAAETAPLSVPQAPSMEELQRFTSEAIEKVKTDFTRITEERIHQALRSILVSPDALRAAESVAAERQRKEDELKVLEASLVTRRLELAEETAKLRLETERVETAKAALAENRSLLAHYEQCKTQMSTTLARYETAIKERSDAADALKATVPTSLSPDSSSLDCSKTRPLAGHASRPLRTAPVAAPRGSASVDSKESNAKSGSGTKAKTLKAKANTTKAKGSDKDNVRDMVALSWTWAKQASKLHLEKILMSVFKPDLHSDAKEKSDALHKLSKDELRGLLLEHEKEIKEESATELRQCYESWLKERPGSSSSSSKSDKASSRAAKAKDKPVPKSKPPATITPSSTIKDTSPSTSSASSSSSSAVSKCVLTASCENIDWDKWKPIYDIDGWALFPTEAALAATRKWDEDHISGQVNPLLKSGGGKVTPWAAFPPYTYTSAWRLCIKPTRLTNEPSSGHKKKEWAEYLAKHHCTSSLVPLDLLPPKLLKACFERKLSELFIWWYYTVLPAWDRHIPGQASVDIVGFTSHPAKGDSNARDWTFLGVKMDGLTPQRMDAFHALRPEAQAQIYQDLGLEYDYTEIDELSRWRVRNFFRILDVVAGDTYDALGQPGDFLDYFNAYDPEPDSEDDDEPEETPKPRASKKSKKTKEADVSAEGEEFIDSSSSSSSSSSAVAAPPDIAKKNMKAMLAASFAAYNRSHQHADSSETDSDSGGSSVPLVRHSAPQSSATTQAGAGTVSQAPTTVMVPSALVLASVEQPSQMHTTDTSSVLNDDDAFFAGGSDGF